MERVNIVVGVGVGRHEVSVSKLDQGVFRTVGHHLIGTRHAHKTGLIRKSGK